MTALIAVKYEKNNTISTKYIYILLYNVKITDRI